MGSWMWKKLLKYRLQAKSFHFMVVRNGEQTSFWHGNWSPLGRLHDTLGDKGFINLGITADATVSDAVHFHRRRHHRMMFLNNVENELENIRLLSSREPDLAKWRRPDGTYKSAFSTSATWQQIRQEGHLTDWHNAVWFSGATPKYSFNLWLIAHNRLSTGDRMLTWNRGVIIGCIFCQQEIETRDHLFFECDFSAGIWKVLTHKLLNQLFTTSFSAILSVISAIPTKNTTCFILRYVLQATTHKIWHERNRRRHGKKHQSPHQLITFIDRMARNSFSSIRSAHPSRLADGLCIWFNSRN